MLGILAGGVGALALRHGKPCSFGEPCHGCPAFGDCTLTQACSTRKSLQPAPPGYASSGPSPI
jgi:hypothetical protein